jgi:hypothetical protein
MQDVLRAVVIGDAAPKPFEWFSKLFTVALCMAKAVFALSFFKIT